MRNCILRSVAVVALVPAISGFRVQGAPHARQMQDFEISGVGLFECQCPAHGCPCQSNGRPTHGTCHASDFAHIASGHYGSVKLDGLSVGMVGNLVDANASRLFATLYVDDRATPEQKKALTEIIEYMNGAYVALASEPPVPFQSVKSVSINFRESSDQTHYELEIPAILQEKALLRRDKSGHPTFTITAMDMWSNTVHNADNLQFEYHDSSLRKNWDYSGHYANLKYFDLTDKMYAEQMMLGQHGDMSGAWTPKQLEIIRQSGLPAK